ncbi:MAG: hypothetical protein WDA02_01305 [Saccharofermentanales bacterium]
MSAINAVRFIQSILSSFLRGKRFAPPIYLKCLGTSKLKSPAKARDQALREPAAL